MQCRSGQMAQLNHKPPGLVAVGPEFLCQIGNVFREMKNQETVTKENPAFQTAMIARLASKVLGSSEYVFFCSDGLVLK